MAVPSLPSKSALRDKSLVARRAYARSLPPTLRYALESELAERVLPHLLIARVIAGYHPLKDEIGPASILAGLGRDQRAVLPWFSNRDSLMVWREGTATEPGPWGVLQPPANAAALAPDLVLVPLVLADRAGRRIGHGKGHYDRALSNLRAGGNAVTTIGLAWESQLSADLLPADPWDQPLDMIATPKEFISCRN